jgi:hypothetical protein
MVGNNGYALFHIMKHGKHVVIFKMAYNGDREVYAPGKAPLDKIWPAYSECIPYIDMWFSQNAGRDIASRHGTRCVISPGNKLYPYMLSQRMTRDQILRLWAYVTAPDISVSFGQVATAMGRQSDSSLREEMENRGLRFSTLPSSRKYVTTLAGVSKSLGSDIADRVLLYPHQAANFLGIRPDSASGVIKGLGIALSRDDMVVVEWAKLRRVRRVGPRKFEVNATE